MPENDATAAALAECCKDEIARRDEALQAAQKAQKALEDQMARAAAIRRKIATAQAAVDQAKAAVEKLKQQMKHWQETGQRPSTIDNDGDSLEQKEAALERALQQLSDASALDGRTTVESWNDLIGQGKTAELEKAKEALDRAVASLRICIEECSAGTRQRDWLSDVKIGTGNGKVGKPVKTTINTDILLPPEEPLPTTLTIDIPAPAGAAAAPAVVGGGVVLGPGITVTSNPNPDLNVNSTFNVGTPSE